VEEEGRASYRSFPIAASAALESICLPADAVLNSLKLLVIEYISTTSVSVVESNLDRRITFSEGGISCEDYYYHLIMEP
jgi:hypothetical protein